MVEADTRIAVAPGSADAVGVAADLAAIMRPSTGYPLPISVATPRPGDIALHLTDAGDLGDEGYRLDVSNAGVRLEAARPAGLFYGVQTLRQLLPALDREPDRTARTLDHVRRTPRIGDLPRYRYRRGDARHRPALPATGRRQASDRPGRRLQGQRAAPACQR